MPDRYYKIRTDYSDPMKPPHIRDSRGMAELMSDLHDDGYLVSESVEVRYAVTGANFGPDMPTQYAYYFEAKPLGEIALLRPHVVEIAEVVVHPDSQPFPD